MQRESEVKIINSLKAGMPSTRVFVVLVWAPRLLSACGLYVLLFWCGHLHLYLHTELESAGRVKTWRSVPSRRPSKHLHIAICLKKTTPMLEEHLGKQNTRRAISSRVCMKWAHSPISHTSQQNKERKSQADASCSIRWAFQLHAQIDSLEMADVMF